MKLLLPTSVGDLVAELAQNEDTKIIAGGTAVVLMMKQGLIFPEQLASLQRIHDLNGVSDTDNQTVIGATTSLRDVAQSLSVNSTFPALAAACGVVGNVRIRNVATLGGNLAEADYASDPPAALVALGATVNIVGCSGKRESSVEELLTGFYSTSLDPTEVITAIKLPKADSPSRQVYLKYRSRSSEDRPCVGVAACAWMSEEGMTIDRLRIVVGAAGARPQRFPNIEQLAEGQALGTEAIATIADGYSLSIDALDDLRGTEWYRRQMTREFVTRALYALSDGERGA